MQNDQLDRVLIDTKMCRWTINRQGFTNDVSYSTLIFLHPPYTDNASGTAHSHLRSPSSRVRNWLYTFT